MPAIRAFLLLACATLPASAAEPPGRPPNIVLFLADDLGVYDLGCYGRREHAPPRLDRLAAEGARFTNAYCAQPICSASRAALLTGKHPARLHLTNYLPGRPDCPAQAVLQPIIAGQLPLEETTLAELLRDAGYVCGLFGKWHLGGEGFSAAEQGFDVVVSPPANNEPSATEGGKGEQRIAAAANAFIEEHRDRPFFCYVPHNCPHVPLSALPEAVAENADCFNPTYAAMLQWLDAAVGNTLETLDRLGLADNTIVIFTSDNGGLHVPEGEHTPATHNGPHRAGKGHIYEGGLRVPLLVRWPAVVAAGGQPATPVVLTDLMPTLLAAAGIDAATTVGPLDGVDLGGVLRGAAIEPRTLFWHFPHYTNQGGRPAGAIRDGDWKLIEQYEDGGLELYDLASDPGETQNLALTQTFVAQQFSDRLHDWLEQVGAQRNTPNPAFDARLHGRLYFEQDPSTLEPLATAHLTAPLWRDWRRAMNDAVRGRQARITPAAGDIRLHAREARIHGGTLRYEAEPHKNVLGYWTKVDDWAEWELTVPTAGSYEIEVQQGCGAGSGGATVLVEIAGQSLQFTVQETGHFQQMIQRSIGQVQLPAGKTTLALKPQTKPGVAVMDVRRVVLRPLP